MIDNVNEKKALVKAKQALELVLADQEDNALRSGTVIKVRKRYFVYDGKNLMAVQRMPDISASVKSAKVSQTNAIVYLFATDGEEAAYRKSGDLVYEIFIDPDDQTIPTYTYSQMNEAVSKFLDEVSYENAADSVSEITKYLDASQRYDRPEGCTVELKSGNLTVYDNGTQNAYTVKVRKGSYTFYNITPGVGGEFYVRNGDKIVQKGHLRPTGALRMIYSETQGLQNMRDLGGWACDGGTVKYNLLIRGGSVIDATDTDRNTWVKLLGIDHDVFVKTYSGSQLAGREQYGTKSPLGERVTLYQKDLSSEGSENKRNFANAKEQMNGIMNSIFDHAIAGETTYFHCLAGADRTGMVAIVIEGILGISKSDIDKDYEITSFNCQRERNHIGYIADINILREYPGVTFRDKCVYYLLDCGITLEKINAFRNAVIDGNPEQITENVLEETPLGMNLCIPNGEGWIDGGRCSSSGSDRYDVASHIVTNYFAVQNGDIVYVKNLNIADTLHSGMYQSDKTPISGFYMTNENGAGFVKDIAFTKEWELFTVDHADAGYLRLCGTLKSTKEDVIINIKRNDQWLTELPIE